MNSHTARALLDDALYQVLDNKVFRMLLIVVVCLIAPTFLIGIREEGIVFLYGWKVIPYADFFKAFGTSIPEVGDVNLAFLEGLQSIVIEGFAGTIGVMFCIAATAFFVPRMLEKGAADTLFSKPVSRFALLVARYFSGVLFVGMLSCVLVFGMYLGFMVGSGYTDTGFLWSAVTLIYVFALLHAFSTCVAAFTRNSIAAILASLMFFVFNGCVHQIWISKEHSHAKELAAAEAAPDPEAPKVTSADSTSAFISLMKGTLDVAHYVLPKTNDAEVITRRLRRMITGEEFVLWDPAGRLTVTHHPRGFMLASQGVTVDLASAPAVWVSGDAAHGAEIRLSRRSRVIETPGDKVGTDETKVKASTSTKLRRQSSNTAARDLEESLEKRTPPPLNVTRAKPKGETSYLRGAMQTDSVSWSENTDGAETEHRTHFFISDDWMYELAASAPASWTAPNPKPGSDDYSLDARVREFIDGLRLEQNRVSQMRPDQWYAKQFDWNARPRYNALVSIAASLSFAAVMLGLAWFRLMRIDF